MVTYTGWDGTHTGATDKGQLHFCSMHAHHMHTAVQDTPHLPLPPAHTLLVMQSSPSHGQLVLTFPGLADTYNLATCPQLI